MKIIFFLLICMFSPLTVLCQENKAVTEKLKGKYGFVCYHDNNGGWYSVVNKVSYGEKGNEGACDLQGREVIPPIWDNVYYGGTYYEVKKNGFVGIRDLNNKELLPCNRFTDIRWYQKSDHGGFCEVGINSRIGVIDKDNKIVIPCEYEDIHMTQIQQYGFCNVEKDGKIGVYDIRLQSLLIPCQYDDIRSFSLEEQSFCCVSQGKLTGVYDIKAKREIIPCEYDKIRDFELKEMEVCRVEKNGLCGLVYSDGKKIVPCRYDDMEESSWERGYCRIIKNGKYGVLNKQGEEILPCTYGYLRLVLDNKNKVAIIQKDAVVKPAYWDDNDNYKYYSDSYIKKGKCGIVDLLTKKEIIPCQYVDIQIADEDLFTFNVGGELPTFVQDEHYKINKTQGGKWGVIDTSNKVLITAEYDNPIQFKDGVAQVSKNGVSSLLPHPKSGSSLTIVNGYGSNDIDVNIPQTGKQNNETFAFIIANENYSSLSGSDYAINDGKIFADYCRKMLGLPENNVRYFEDASFGNINSAVKLMEDIANVYEGDASIIFYYSGLGFTDEQSKNRYLLPVDTDISTVSKTGYNLQLLIEKLNSLNTKTTLAIIDAPFSGTDRNGNAIVKNRGIRIVPKTINPKGNVLICLGSSGNECAYALSKYGHGLFTYSLLKQLKQNNASGTWGDWINNASILVKKESISKYNKTQNPYVIKSETNTTILKNHF